VGSAVFSPDLCLAIKHKLPSDTSIFSAEVWAIFQVLILFESFRSTCAAIFSDSRSVLNALSSPVANSGSNDLIPMIRDKYSEGCYDEGRIFDTWAWVPSHWGIFDNEKADLLARQAAKTENPNSESLLIDFFPPSQRLLKDKYYAFLENKF